MHRHAAAASQESAARSARALLDPLGASVDPEEILRRLKKLRDSGERLEIKNVDERASPWLPSGLRTPLSSTMHDLDYVRPTQLLGRESTSERHSMFSSSALDTDVRRQQGGRLSAIKNEPPLSGVNWLASSVCEFPSKDPCNPPRLSPRCFRPSPHTVPSSLRLELKDAEVATDQGATNGGGECTQKLRMDHPFLVWITYASKFVSETVDII